MQQQQEPWAKQSHRSVQLAGLLTAVLVCFLPSPVISQEEEPGERIGKKYDPETIRKQQEIEDGLRGISPSERHEIDAWKISNGGATDKDYFAAKERSKRLKESRAAIYQRAHNLLDLEAAHGWGFVGYVGGEPQLVHTPLGDVPGPTRMPF